MSALVVTLGGCVFFVSSPDIGDHCAFRGRDTACGSCLADKCSLQIDSCCRSGDCNGIIDTVEACAAAGGSACNDLQSNVTSTTSLGVAVQLCARNRCSAVCQNFTGDSQTTCRQDFLSDGLTCSCGFAEPGNDFECSSTTFPNTKCCAPAAWPGPALQCRCLTISCASTTEGCVCILTDNTSTDLSRTCAGQHCCAKDDACHCASRPCQPAEREVDECALPELTCPPGTSERPSCSIRTTP